MSTDTTRAASTESTETAASTVTEIGSRPVGLLRDRSDLIAEAARVLEETVEGRTEYSDDFARSEWTDRIAWGDRHTAVRQHADVLLKMDQAESLGALVEAATKAGARDALVGEGLIDALETAGQSTAVVLGQVVAQLEKLNENLDGHRAALVDTAGELRAEVENLTTAVNDVENEVREVGLAVDRVGTSIDCLDTEAHARTTAAGAKRVSAARGLLKGALASWGAALMLLAWAWISTTDPQLPDWMAPAGFGAGGVLALLATLLTGVMFGRSGEAAAEPTPTSSSPVVWGGMVSGESGSGKSAGLLDQVAHRLDSEDATGSEARS